MPRHGVGGTAAAGRPRGPGDARPI